MMNEPGKSDRPEIPVKLPNNAKVLTADGKGLAKGNLVSQNASRTLNRTAPPSALKHVRQAAKRYKKVRLIALLHHVYNLKTLRMAYSTRQRETALGVDGETWRPYDQAQDKNLKDLSARLRLGAYRAKPVRRVHIPKADGRQRPLGGKVLEDKVVQRATVEVLNSIYETDFLGFSYGFCPGRSPHRALDASYTGLLR